MPLPLLWTDVPLHPAAVELLRGQVELSGPALPPAVTSLTPFEFESAHAAMVGPRRKFDAAAFDRAPRLRVIARTGIGYDNVDVTAASAAGICVVNTPDAPTESTAELAIGLMFAVARRIATADHNAKAGQWKLDPSVLGFDLADKNLGLVGFGRIARRVTEIARAIRLRVFACDPFVAPAVISAAGATPCNDLADLLPQAQVLSLHAPATPATRHLIGSTQLAALPRGAIVINTARGPLLDPAALLVALESGQIAGAGLDVWEVEPAPPDDPLLRHPRVVATPHMAAFTEEGRFRSHTAAARYVLQTLRDEPPETLVDRTIWDRRRR